MPKVELISNITHHYYTALSVSHLGYLGHYIAGPSALDGEAWLNNLGGPFERLWVERHLKGIPPHLVRRIWLAEIIQKGMSRVAGIREKANWAHNQWFASKAASLMGECDAVHFVNSVGWIAARKAKMNGAKVICDIREEHPNFQERILSEEARILGIDTFATSGSATKQRVLEELDLADHIFCPSSYAKRTFVEQGIAEKLIVVCPYGVDTAKFTPRQYGKHSERFTVLFLGNICMRKGVHYLLEAFKMARLKGARLVLAGPIDPDFRSILQKYDGLFDAVGPISRSQVQTCYQQADVFVMPSLADSYGLVVAEAMSAGIPVIVSENTGANEIMNDGVEGFVVPIRNARSICDNLTFLFENREKCDSMGLAGTLSAKVMDWNKYEATCADFYRTLFH
jgi:starch synthase